MKLAADQYKRIEDLYHTYFKDSKMKICDFESFGKTNYLWLDFYLAKDTTELPYTYWENDCFKIGFELSKCCEGLCLKARSKSYFIKPIYNNWLAYDRREIAFRQVKGDFEKVFAALKKFFEKLHAQVIEDIDNNIITAGQHFDVAKLRTVRGV